MLEIVRVWADLYMVACAREAHVGRVSRLTCAARCIQDCGVTCACGCVRKRGSYRLIAQADACRDLCAGLWGDLHVGANVRSSHGLSAQAEMDYSLRACSRELEDVQRLSWPLGIREYACCLSEGKDRCQTHVFLHDGVKHHRVILLTDG